MAERTKLSIMKGRRRAQERKRAAVAPMTPSEQLHRYGDAHASANWYAQQWNPGLRNSAGLDPLWYAQQANPYFLEQQRNLGMGQRMQNPTAGPEQTDLNESPHRPNVDVSRIEQRDASVLRAHFQKLAVGLSKLAQQLSQLFRREVR